MDDLEIFRRLGLALAIGLLFGLERGWHGREKSEGSRTAGIRTFALTGLLGGICGWLVTFTAPVVLAVALLALSALLAVSYWVRMAAEGDLGLTTEVALLLAFALGAVSVLGEMAPAAAAAVVAALLLSMKGRLHGLIERIERLELEALLKLALISVVILPLLPDQGYGPGQTLNPYDLWRAVVIVAGLSFCGYVAIRLAGANIGILMTGLFGGLASSTSTTLVLSRLVRSQGALVSTAAAGIIVAGAVAFLRILVLVAIFQPQLIAPLALPMGVMAATGLVGAALIRGLSDSAQDAPDAIEGFSNPLALKTALSFGVLLAIVLVGVHYLETWLGTGGVYVAAALSGLTDVDALTISVARLVNGDLAAAQGTIAIFIAASVNTAVKAGISFGVGGPGLGLRVIACNAAIIAAGGASLWLGG